MTSAPHPHEAVDTSGGASGAVRRLALFLVVAVVGVVVTRYTHLGRFLDVKAITEFAAGLGPRGPLYILLAGALMPLLFLPRWPIAFLAGMLYGVVGGTLLATVASTVGAWLHFLLSRTLLAPMSDRLRHKYRLDHLTIPKDKQFLALFILRAFPLSNFVATNLVAGALKLSRSRYVVASFLGMIPSTLMYAAWGKLMKKPDPHFYALAIASLVVVVLGAVAAQKYVYPWFRGPAAGDESRDAAYPGAD